MAAPIESADMDVAEQRRRDEARLREEQQRHLAERQLEWAPIVTQWCTKDIDLGLRLCDERWRVDTEDIDACRAICTEARYPRQPIAEPPRGVVFTSTLKECIARVRRTGGSEPPVCHFPRPLDEMDFGQQHCNARCAAAAGFVPNSPPSRRDR